MQDQFMKEDTSELSFHGLESIIVHPIYCQFFGDRNVWKFGKTVWAVPNEGLEPKASCDEIYQGIKQKLPKCRLKLEEVCFIEWVSDQAEDVTSIFTPCRFWLYRRNNWVFEKKKIEGL